MPTVHVELFEGRTKEQKAALAKELTDVFVRVLGSKPEGVDVLFVDIKKQDWATGGVLWSEQKG